MIDREHALPVSRQVRLVGIARSSAYYEPHPVSEADLKLMRRLDDKPGHFSSMVRFEQRPALVHLRQIQRRPRGTRLKPIPGYRVVYGMLTTTPNAVSTQSSPMPSR